MSEKHNTWHTELPTCPHCGEKAEDDGLNVDGVLGCGNCGEDFKYIRNVSVTYTTAKV